MMKPEEITTDFIESIKPKVLRTAKKIIICSKLTFVEHTHFNLKDEDSNYIVFSAYNPHFKCLQSVTYDVEYDCIDIRTWRTKCN